MSCLIAFSIGAGLGLALDVVSDFFAFLLDKRKVY